MSDVLDSLARVEYQIRLYDRFGVIPTGFSRTEMSNSVNLF